MTFSVCEHFMVLKELIWHLTLNSREAPNILLTAEELRMLNRTSIEVPGETVNGEQGHLGLINVFHHLHCLVGGFPDAFCVLSLICVTLWH